jgi:hypothetical protein
VTCKHHHQDPQKLKGSKARQQVALRTRPVETAAASWHPSSCSQHCQREQQNARLRRTTAIHMSRRVAALNKWLSLVAHAPPPLSPRHRIHTNLHKLYIFRLFAVSLPCAHCIYLNSPCRRRGPKFCVSQFLPNLPIPNPIPLNSNSLLAPSSHHGQSTNATLPSYQIRPH